MEMTPEMIIEIRNEVFGDKEWPFLKERLYALYKKAMELAPSSEKEVILSEIKELEMMQRRDTVKVLCFYDDITLDDIIGDYSKTAFLLAKKHKEKAYTSLLAKYMKKAFIDMIESNDYNKVISSSRNKKIISESLLDFNYASGYSEMMSLRLSAEISA